MLFGREMGIPYLIQVGEISDKIDQIYDLSCIVFETMFLHLNGTRKKCDFFDWLTVKQLNKTHLRDIRHSVHDAAVNIICLLYHLAVSILLWFPSNLNLDPDITNQSPPSSAAAGWKVCLWAFASVYHLDQSPKNSEAESKKNTVSFRILP